MGNAVDDRRLGPTRLGSYEILRKLARGGMAEILLARAVGPEGFEKLVVLKKILPQFAANPKFVKLFLDEARLAAGFEHPHIAHVYDMGMVEGHYFFTMEYVHGQDVRSVLRRTDRSNRQLPIDHAVQIARNVAAALHYAHERRRPDGGLLDIVHRDVSPSNIVVSYDGAVKLLDFGVAKAASSSVKTRTGTLKGKIAYMSPEQARGATIDRRSDIFSLGIVLWEMVATRRLYKAENDLATIQLIINTEAPPPSVVRADCPPELERIVMRALSPDLGRRYQTAQELQLDLEELAREGRLNQSSIALSKYMNEMFYAEIQAWLDAQQSGITLTDHMTGAGLSELTTPVSEADIESGVSMGDGDGDGDEGEDDGEGNEADELPGIEGARRARRATAVPQEMPAVTAPMRPVPAALMPVPPPMPMAAPIGTAMEAPSGPMPAAVSGASGVVSAPGSAATGSIPAWNSSSQLSVPQGSMAGVSGSVPGVSRSRAPRIMLATVAVIAVGIGIGAFIAKRGGPARTQLQQTQQAQPQPPEQKLTPTPPPTPTPTPPAPAVIAKPPEPAVIAKPSEPAPADVQKPSTDATGAAKIRSKKKPKPAPKKPPEPFNPNAALPPE